MHHAKSAKIYLCFAVLLLVAKPFLGFSMFSSTNPPPAQSIFVKAFTKRKQEYVENSRYDIHTVQKKLAEPVQQFSLRFSLLLDILFSAIVAALAVVTGSFLHTLQLNLSQRRSAYLLNRQLLI
jgi:hypothetical protein